VFQWNAPEIQRIQPVPAVRLCPGCINITNIDDEINLSLLYFYIALFFFYLKISKRAREKHLITKYMNDSSISLQRIIEDCQLALKVKYKIQKKFALLSM
jgi:hypothetical protein